MGAGALLGLAVVLLGLSVQSAAAQTRKPTAQEVAAIRNCAAKYQDNLDEVEQQCLFKLVGDPCTETPEGSSNVGTADCYRLEAAIWDNLLNENFKNLLGTLDDQQAAKASRHAACLDRLSRHNMQFLLGQDSMHDGNPDERGL
jgi:hypothetical protein